MPAKVASVGKASFARRRWFLIAAAIVCVLAALYIGHLARTSAGKRVIGIALPIRVLIINAVAAFLSVVLFESLVGLKTVLSKPQLVLPLMAPVAIFAFELLREREWTSGHKPDQFASFRAAVLVSAALASAASLPKETAKIVVSGCLIVAAAVLPLSSASDDSVTGTMAQSLQRALMVLLTWSIVGVVMDKYTIRKLDKGKGGGGGGGDGEEDDGAADAEVEGAE